MLLFPRHKSGMVGVRLLLIDTGHYLVPIHQPGATQGENTLFFRSNSPEVDRARRVFLSRFADGDLSSGQPGGGPESKPTQPQRTALSGVPLAHEGRASPQGKVVETTPRRMAGTGDGLRHLAPTEAVRQQDPKICIFNARGECFAPCLGLTT